MIDLFQIAISNAFDIIDKNIPDEVKHFALIHTNEVSIGNVDDNVGVHIKGAFKSIKVNEGHIEGAWNQL